MYEALAASGGANIKIVIPPKKTATVDLRATGPWRQRNEAIERIGAVGRRQWRKESGAYRQAQAEKRDVPIQTHYRGSSPSPALRGPPEGSADCRQRHQSGDCTWDAGIGEGGGVRASSPKGQDGLISGHATTPLRVETDLTASRQPLHGQTQYTESLAVPTSLRARRLTVPSYNNHRRTEEWNSRAAKLDLNPLTDLSGVLFSMRVSRGSLRKEFAMSARRAATWWTGAQLSLRKKIAMSTQRCFRRTAITLSEVL